MESLGSPNRIHVTQKTADELIMLGKKEWLTPRSQKIQAKGKGEMQTYWVNISSSASRARRTSGGTRAIQAADPNDDIEESRRDFSTHDEEEKSSTDMVPETN